MEDELEHVCAVADIGRKTKQKLADHSISSVQELVAASGILDPNKGVEKALLKVIAWYKWFQQTNSRAPYVLTELTEDAFDSYQQNNRTFDLPEDCLPDTFRALRDNEEFMSMVEKRNLIPTIENKQVERSIAQMIPELKASLGTFDYKGFTHEIVKCFSKTRKNGNGKPIALVLGKTQSGKSSVKGMAAVACHEERTPQIIITMGVSESKELTKKEQAFVKDPSLVVGVSSPDIDGKGMGWKRKHDLILSTLEKGGTIVCADTAQQVEKVTSVLRKYLEHDPPRSFVLTVDECDHVICRTSHQTTKIEEAYYKLTNLKPCLSIFISATILPVMLEVIHGDYYSSSDVVGVFNIETLDDYHGFNDMKLMKDEEGKDVFLDQSELAYSNMYTSPKESKFIEDFLKDPEQKGGLYLDCTNPRVYAPGNVRQKAEMRQSLCAEEHQRDVIVMIHTSKGIEVRVPGAEWELMDKKTKKFSDVVDELDEQYGQRMPILCFAFTKFRRGISCRGTNRFPTHYVAALGGGHHIMNLVQTIGRATGNGKSVLARNGFETSKLLMSSRDYITVKRNLHYLRVFNEKLDSGESFQAAMTGTDKELPDEANFIRNTKRQVSRLKEHKEFVANNFRFQEPPENLSHDEINLRNNMFSGRLHQMVLCTIHKLAISNPVIDFDDINHGVDETYEDEIETPIRKPDLTRILKDLDPVVIKRSEKLEGKRYCVDKPQRIVQFIMDDQIFEKCDNEPSSEEKEDSSDDEQSSLGSSPVASSPVARRPPASYSNNNDDESTDTDEDMKRRALSKKKKKSPGRDKANLQQLLDSKDSSRDDDNTTDDEDLDRKLPSKRDGYDEAVIDVALYNYECFYGMTHGTATFDMVKSTSAGIAGWAASVIQEGTKTPADTPKQDTVSEVEQKKQPENRARRDEDEDRQLQMALLESVGACPSRAAAAFSYDYNNLSSNEYAYDSGSEGEWSEQSSLGSSPEASSPVARRPPASYSNNNDDESTDTDEDMKRRALSKKKKKSPGRDKANLQQLLDSKDSSRDDDNTTDDEDLDRKLPSKKTPPVYPTSPPPMKDDTDDTRPSTSSPSTPKRNVRPHKPMATLGIPNPPSTVVTPTPSVVGKRQRSPPVAIQKTFPESDSDSDDDIPIPHKRQRPPPVATKKTFLESDNDKKTPPSAEEKKMPAAPSPGSSKDSPIAVGNEATATSPPRGVVNGSAASGSLGQIPEAVRGQFSSYGDYLTNVRWMESMQADHQKRSHPPDDDDSFKTCEQI